MFFEYLQPLDVAIGDVTKKRLIGDYDLSTCRAKINQVSLEFFSYILIYLEWFFMNHIAFLKFFFVFSFSRQKQDEVMKLESQIRYKAEEQRKAGQELDSTCQICLKTKFADGIGHICNYCNVRCCARCGGKVALRSSKVRFMCKVNSEMESKIHISTKVWVRKKQTRSKIDH